MGQKDIRALEAEVLVETDWAQFEREIERKLRREEPGACPHYTYPMGLDNMKHEMRNGEMVVICRLCNNPF